MAEKPCINKQINEQNQPKLKQSCLDAEIKYGTWIAVTLKEETLEIKNL
jgi:hypothetical protein